MLLSNKRERCGAPEFDWSAPIIEFVIASKFVMTLKTYPLEFPKGDHRSCRELTALTLDHLPRDGSLGEMKNYRRDANVWQPGDREDRIYFLRRGQIALTVADADGREVVLRVVNEGESFGEMCYCGADANHTSFARVVAAAETVEIRFTDFLTFLRNMPDALAGLVFTFCIRLSDASRRLEILTQRGAEERLGRLLLHLVATRRATNSASSDEAILQISHEELAQMAAISRPHVTITLNKFRMRGLVRYERNRPLVVNVPLLKKHFDG